MEAAGRRDGSQTAINEPTPADATAPEPVEAVQPSTAVDIDDHGSTGIAGVPGIGPDTQGAEQLGLAWRIFTVHREPRSRATRLRARTCPTATTCDAHRLGRSRWPTDDGGRVAMPYRYSDAGRPSGRAPSASSVYSALRLSAAEWNRWNSNTAFTDAGTSSARFNATGADGSCDDGVNVVTWRYLQTDALAATAICYDRRTYEIRDVDTALNAAHNWASFSEATDGASAYDVRAIITHELGHWLSLLDLRSSLRESGQTMYQEAAPGEIRKRTLALGDIVGSQTAYPCSSGDRCPRTGVADD
jgi:hypothetical protein